MIALAPVFDAWAKDLLGLEGHEGVLRRVFGALLDFAGPGCAMAVSDVEGVLELARSMGLGALRADAPSRYPLPTLDHGTRQWLLDLLPGVQESVLVADAGNPLLDADLLRDFMARFKEDPSRPLVSVRAPEDHPCQSYMAVRVVDAGSMVVLREQDGETLVSRPVPPDILAMEHIGGKGPLCCRREGGLVRLSARASWLERTLGYRSGPVGLALDAAGNLVFGLHERDRRLSLTWPAHDRSGTLRCQMYFPVSGRRLQALGPGPVAQGTSETMRPEYLARETLAVYVVLNEVHTGSMDFQRMYAPAGADWYFDENAGRLRIKGSGEIIHGRQAFPSVVEGDGSLLAVDLRQDQAGSGLQGCRCFFLERGQSLHVHSELDMLRLEAKLLAVSS